MSALEQIKIFLKQKGIKKNITEQTEFKNLGLDSLDLMDLVIIAEKKFNIIIPDDELLKIRTIADLIKLIENQKG